MVERFDAFEYEHRRDGLVVVCLAYGAVQRGGDRLDLRLRVLQVAFGLRHLEFDVEFFAARDHALRFESCGVFEVLAHAVHHLLPYDDDLSCERQPVVAFDEFRYQRVALLDSLRSGRLFVDPRRTVGGVDLAAHPQRNRHVAADESQTAVLQRQCPAGRHRSAQHLRNGGDVVRRDHAALKDLSREILHRRLHIVEIDFDVLTQIGVTARDADLRHTQTDGSAALLLCGAAVELGGPNGRIVRKRHFECLFQRQRPPLFLCGKLHDGRQGEHNQRDFFHIFYTYDVAKIEIIRFKCVFVRTKRTFLVRLVHFFSIRGDRGGR